MIVVKFFFFFKCIFIYCYVCMELWVIEYKVYFEYVFLFFVFKECICVCVSFLLRINLVGDFGGI